jgi:hypothetical protein
MLMWFEQSCPQSLLWRPGQNNLIAAPYLPRHNFVSETLRRGRVSGGDDVRPMLACFPAAPTANNGRVRQQRRLHQDHVPAIHIRFWLNTLQYR